MNDPGGRVSRLSAFDLSSGHHVPVNRSLSHSRSDLCSLHRACASSDVACCLYPSRCCQRAAMRPPQSRAVPPLRRATFSRRPSSLSQISTMPAPGRCVRRSSTRRMAPRFGSTPRSPARRSSLPQGSSRSPKSLTIEGPLPAGITISGNLSSRVFRVEQNATVVLRNLSIVNGRFVNGAGVLNQGTLTLDHVLLANNETTGDGGGLGIVGAATQTTILNSTISGNVARRGGGIAANRTVIIRNSTIAENTAGEGGGMFVEASDAIVNLRNSIIANNADNDPANAVDAQLRAERRTSRSCWGPTCRTTKAAAPGRPSVSRTPCSRRSRATAVRRRRHAL